MAAKILRRIALGARFQFGSVVHIQHADSDVSLCAAVLTSVRYNNQRVYVGLPVHPQLHEDGVQPFHLNSYAKVFPLVSDTETFVTAEPFSFNERFVSGPADLQLTRLDQQLLKKFMSSALDLGESDKISYLRKRTRPEIEVLPESTIYAGEIIWKPSVYPESFWKEIPLSEKNFRPYVVVSSQVYHQEADAVLLRSLSGKDVQYKNTDELTFKNWMRSDGRIKSTRVSRTQSHLSSMPIRFLRESPDRYPRHGEFLDHDTYKLIIGKTRRYLDVRITDERNQHVTVNYSTAGATRR